MERCTPISIFVPRLYPPDAGDQYASGRRYSITVWGTCEPPFRENEVWSYLNEPDRRSPMGLALVVPRSDLRLSTASPRFEGNEASYDRLRDGRPCRLCY